MNGEGDVNIWFRTAVIVNLVTLSRYSFRSDAFAKLENNKNSNIPGSFKECLP